MTDHSYLCNRHMYWANGGKKPTIERADLDGSNRNTVIDNVRIPTGLTIDYSSGLIFWVDIDNQVIECAYLDGTNRRIVALGLSQPFALTLYKDYIYWTDRKLKSVYRANKTNGLDKTKIISHTEYIMDILVFHSSRQRGLCMFIILILSSPQAQISLFIFATLFSLYICCGAEFVG